MDSLTAGVKGIQYMNCNRKSLMEVDIGTKLLLFDAHTTASWPNLSDLF